MFICVDDETWHSVFYMVEIIIVDGMISISQLLSLLCLISMQMSISCLLQMFHLSRLRESFKPICCAFVFKCKLLICTHLGGASLFLGNMLLIHSWCRFNANPSVVI